MNTPQYDAYEQSLNEVASGVTLFLTALVDTLREIDRLPPEGRTTTALVEHLASVLEVLEGREYVTQDISRPCPVDDGLGPPRRSDSA